MKPAPFAYHDPRSIDDALALLARHGDDAKVLAGGQSLMPLMNFRLARPAVVVDINRIPDLDGIREIDGALVMGALARQRGVERWAGTRSPLLAAALRYVGHDAIRTRGTVAGSLAHADPAAELPALLLCLDGHVQARSGRGARPIAARDLFVAALTTSLRPDEVITEVRLPMLRPGEGWGFEEVARRHGDFALAGAVATVAVDGGRVSQARIAVFACGPTPVRAHDAERVLAGSAPTAEAVDTAARVAAEALDPEGDLHASAAYRKRVARTLVARALAAAAGRATAR
jgi:carbon-monoxide dehydrogenase medium subunit